MQYKQLTIEEREKIQEMLWQKQSVRAMAKELGRSPSSISREINRHRPPERRIYTPRLAQERAMEYRSHRGREQRLKNNRVREYVVKHLKLGWSPEQIANTINKSIGELISHEAIYQYICPNS
jgi:IS30 family transposase